MAKFRVQCFNDGEWDDKPFSEIEADTPEQAAVLACGGPVRVMVGRKDELRARVWPKGKDRPEYLFFAPHPRQ